MSAWRSYPLRPCRDFLPLFKENVGMLPEHTSKSLPSNLGITTFVRLT
jgi:hypothetical protein